MLAELEELAGALRAAGSPVAANLRPGITVEELERQAARLPFQLPPDVRDLFRWHDGAANPGLMGRDLVPDGSFCPLAAAVDRYLHYAQLFDLDGDPDGGGMWRIGQLPILGGDSKSMWVALCTEIGPSGTPCGSTILEEDVLTDMAPSLRHFAARSAARWRAGNYVADPSGFAGYGVLGYEIGYEQER